MSAGSPQPAGKGIEKTTDQTGALWQAVVHMGRQLLASRAGKYAASEDLRARRELIEATAQRVLDCQAEVWLSSTLLPNLSGKPGEDSPDDEHDFPRLPPNQALAEAVARQATSFYPGEEAPTRLSLPFLPFERTSPAQGALGGLVLERPAGSPFSPAEIALAEGLAAQVCIALQAEAQMALERWRVEQLILVRRVSGQIASLRDLDELARRVTRLIFETFHYYYVSIYTLEPDHEALQFRGSAGPRDLPESSPEAHLPGIHPIPSAIRLGQGMVGTTAQTGQELLANDVRSEAHYVSSAGLPNTLAEFSLPLKVENRVVGVLDVQSNQVDDFHEIDVLVLRALAGYVAIAVEETILNNSLRRRAEQLSAIAEVSQAITSILEADKLLDEVVNLIQKRFGYRFVHLFSVHPGRRKVFYEAGSQLERAGTDEEPFSYDLDDPHGILPWVARQGETILANDVEREPRYRPSPLPPDETRSELAVPLVFGGQVLGVLDVQSAELNAFGEDDRFLFEALADVVAVAMRNATLYRSEMWRRRVADSLREVAGLLSADVDLDQVLDAILAELLAMLPCRLAAIWLLDEEFAESRASDADEQPLLRLAAVAGPDAQALSRADLNLAIATNSSPNQSPGWLAGALHAGAARVRLPDDPVDPIGALLGYPAEYSAIATPLRVGEEPLGVLLLVHPTDGRYGSEAQAMTAAFASYAAVAIENTRLYEAAHAQAWVSTVLLQVAEATQSIPTLDELLNTVTRITPMLVGVRSCALYLLDEEDVFVPAAASGLDSEQQAEFESWRFAPGEAPILDQLRLQLEASILHAGMENTELLGALSTEDGRLPLGAELLVVAPLAARGAALGALLVDYQAEFLAANGLGSLFSEQLTIVQGIAHQTATAVENIRLNKSQKEEAYVSVALLQVAQAIVSTHDLSEILESVVRITPILVGVKRTLIYLWDEHSQVFTLEASYGLPRHAADHPLRPEEFPLLDAARQEDRLLAYPLSGEAPGEPPEIWMNAAVPDREAVARALQSEPCLLMAIPMWVQGRPLGVLLVEEPEAPHGGSASAGGVNRRLREKRLEITTGISQQAALAIANARLQHERVDRERLEREMQLARDIQRTFLPSRLPALPGWDMDVRWRTAHEVGGDFYDYFELPANRLGLVIADVADKGMPAALFMTLSRTLVRAAVQDTDSPAEVLARVNDVMVPDAHGGMFVTLFYGVLDLASGELTYANAGHNPPLALRAGGDVQRLEHGGMALGVQAGSLAAEHRLSLQPGDCLVLYSDGLTEVFAPSGEMFAEAGLRQALQAAGQAGETLSAADLLDGLEMAVNTFRFPNPLDDDLTVIALKRVDAPGEERAA